MRYAPPSFRFSLAAAVALAVLGLAGCGSQDRSEVDLAFAGEPTATQTRSTSEGVEEVTVDFSIANHGERAAAATGWRLTVSQVTISGVIPALAPGDSITVSVPVDGLEPGPHQLSVVIDPTDAVREDSESNNEAVVPVTVVAQGLDLWFSETPTLDPRPIHPGDPAVLRFSIGNRSASLDDANAVTWRVLDYDRIIGSGAVVGSLPAGATANESFDLSGTPGVTVGPHSLTVVIDPRQAIVETDETNDVSDPVTYEILPSASG